MEEEYYEDFYDEEYEFLDSKIQEFKEELKKDVKIEIQNRIAKLEKENKELEQVKENWKNIKREYEKKIEELEEEKINLERDFNKKQLDELLKDVSTEVYRVKDEWIKKEKCNNCDKYRDITVKDCFGREHKVKCVCNDVNCIKVVKRENLYISEISRKSYGDHGLRSFIEEKGNGAYWSTSTINEDIVFLDKFNLEKIKSKDYEKTYFYTKEEAQKYADYLNSKEE